MSNIPTNPIKIAFERAGGRCAFPGCNTVLVTPDGTVMGEIAHIRGIFPGSPRYDSSSDPDALVAESNLIALCPNCHAYIDHNAHLCSVSWLEKAKREHEARVRAAFSSAQLTPVELDRKGPLSFKAALKTWDQQKDNGNEEFWQQLFTDNPKLIAQVVPNSVVQIGAKCYVGGKDISNHGDNILDFLYACSFRENVWQ